MKKTCLYHRKLYLCFMETLVRITFWFKGAMHNKKIIRNTVDGYIDIDEDDNKDYILNRAEDALSTMITKGLVDTACDAGVADFGVTKVSFKFKGKANWVY